MRNATIVMPADESESEDDDEVEVPIRKKSRREAMREHGIESWAEHHSTGLCLSLVAAAVFLGWPSWRLERQRQEDALQEKKDLERLKLQLAAPPKVRSWDTLYEVLGCYRLRNGDWVNDPDLRDRTCMTKGAMGTPCRSGLPFYRFAMLSKEGKRAPMSWRQCAAFCTFKGFDVSGVVNSVECRCGATVENSDIWHGEDILASREDLVWQPPWEKVANDDPKCAILAARFMGELPIRDLGYDRTYEDMTYVRSIVQGGLIASEEPMPPPTEKITLAEIAARPLQRRLAATSGEELRGCYPLADGDCSSGMPWPVRAEFKRTGIPFCIDDNTVSKETKAMIYGVIKDLSKTICVQFNQVSPYYNKTYKIRIQGGSGCSTNFIGYPAKGSFGDTIMTLGWCRTEQEKGSFLHELGHALGMNHEQTRPDRDKYVKINWESMSSEEQRQQYRLDPDGYTGSQTKGHLPYDYESIMHYPLTEQMHTLPVTGGQGAHDSQIGQRQQLSPGDVMQLRNMYHCDRSKLPCIDSDKGLFEHGPYVIPEGVGCAEIAAAGYCIGPPAQAESVRYWCAKSCGACPEDLPMDDVEGCNDAPNFAEICQNYLEYCPGKVPGFEQFMMRKCRKTCHVPQFCGTTTTQRFTTTTTAPLPNPEKKTVSVNFDIVGGGYNLKSKEELVLLTNDLKVRTEDTFGTSAHVHVVPYSDYAGKSTIQLECGCSNPKFRCSKPCSELQDQLDSVTAEGPQIINRELRTRGLSGVEVSSANLGAGGATATIQKALDQPTTQALALSLGGIALALAMGLVAFWYWLHGEDERDDDGDYESLVS